MAGGAQADGDDVSAAGLQTEGAVKRSHFVNLAVGNADFSGQIGQCGFGKVVVVALDGLKDHDQVLLVHCRILLVDHGVQRYKVDLLPRLCVSLVPHSFTDLPLEITLHENEAKLLLLCALLNHRAVFNTGTAPGAQIHVDAAGAFFDFYLEMAGVALDGLSRSA
jgi:hypothetical protein